MKVLHRPVLDSSCLQIERNCIGDISQFYNISYAIVPDRRQKKTTLAVAVIGCDTADSGNG